jgi:hypothetical protein
VAKEAGVSEQARVKAKLRGMTTPQLIRAVTTLSKELEAGEPGTNPRLWGLVDLMGEELALRLERFRAEQRRIRGVLNVWW